MGRFSKLIKPAHASVARSIGYALTSATASDWDRFTAVTLLRLDDFERVSLAFAAMRGLHPDHIDPTVQAVCEGYRIDPPIAPLFNYYNEAVFWAYMADPKALEAYALASFNRMAPDRQAAFLGHVQRRDAA